MKKIISLLISTLLIVSLSVSLLYSQSDNNGENLSDDSQNENETIQESDDGNESEESNDIGVEPPTNLPDEENADNTDDTDNTDNTDNTEDNENIESDENTENEPTEHIETNQTNNSESAQNTNVGEQETEPNNTVNSNQDRTADPALDESDDSTPVKPKNTIAFFPLKDSSNDPDYAYLSTLVMDSVYTILEQRRIFTLMTVDDSLQAAVEVGLNPENFINNEIDEDILIEFFKSTGATIILLGNYTADAANNKLSMSLKVLSVIRGSVVATNNFEASLSDVYAGIDNICVQFEDVILTKYDPKKGELVAEEEMLRKKLEEKISAPQEVVKPVIKPTLVKVHPLRKLGIIVGWGILGGIGAASYVGFSVIARLNYTDYDSLYATYMNFGADTDQEFFDNQFESAETAFNKSKLFSRLSYIGLGVAGLGAGLGLFFFMYAKEVEQKPDVAFSGSYVPGGGTISFTIRF